MDCLFCKIAAGEIPSTKVYEDDMILAFEDIAPQAPVHVVIIPKAHIAENAAGIDKSNSAVIAHIYEAVPQIAAKKGLTDFRVITNCGHGAGQTVYHLHFHLLGGKTLEHMC